MCQATGVQLPSGLRHAAPRAICGKRIDLGRVGIVARHCLFRDGSLDTARSFRASTTGIRVLPASQRTGGAAFERLHLCVIGSLRHPHRPWPHRCALPSNSTEGSTSQHRQPPREPVLPTDQQSRSRRQRSAPTKVPVFSRGPVPVSGLPAQPAEMAEATTTVPNQTQ